MPTRIVGSGTGAVERELARLEGSGLVATQRIGNQKHYQANRNSPIFAELHGIVVKTVGMAEPLRAALAPFGDRIKAAFVYGSLAKGTDTAASDIDLMWLYGFGFPRYRGGLMFWADGIGSGEVYRQIEEWHQRYGARWKPAGLLSELGKSVSKLICVVKVKTGDDGKLFGTVTAGVRGMTKTESARTLTVYQLMWLTLFNGLTLPFAFKAPALSDMPMIVANFWNTLLWLISIGAFSLMIATYASSMIRSIVATYVCLACTLLCCHIPMFQSGDVAFLIRPDTEFDRRQYA